MSCDCIRDRFSEVLDGRADAATHAEVASHVAACAPCSSLLRRMRGAVALLAEMAELAEPAPGGLAERVLARVAPPAMAPGAATRQRRAPGTRGQDLRRVAGWGLVLVGLGWQLGGGALAAQAMTEAAPVIASARETVARTRQAGIAAELERAGAGVSGIARGMRSARLILNSPDGVRPASEDP
jgi:anti-sigma factor RsiW